MSKKDNELVHHPRHYNAHPSGVECIDIIQEFPFNIGTAIKHLWRAGIKPKSPMIQDLQKAREYIDFEIKRQENIQKTQQSQTQQDAEKSKQVEQNSKPWLKG